MKIFKLLKNQKGQSLIEFVLFLPFMMMIYSVIINVSGAINASLNQQKVTRAYFYYNMQNNSTIPKPRRNGPDPSDSWQKFGMQIMGWATELADSSGDGGLPVAACFKFNLPLGTGEEDNCEDAYSGKATQYIRVGTVYGVCGATYKKSGGSKIRLPSGGIPVIEAVEAQGCWIQ
jgi:hypothetical protein